MGPRHNLVKKSSPCSPELKKRFYDHYVRIGTTKATAKALGLSKEMVHRVLVSEAVSDEAKAKITAALDAQDKLLVSPA